MTTESHLGNNRSNNNRKRITNLSDSQIIGDYGVEEWKDGGKFCLFQLLTFTIQN